MSWTTRFVALSLLVALFVEPLRAEPSAGPPDWNDGASVYLKMAQQATRDTTATADSHEAKEAGWIAPTLKPAPKIDHEVTPTAHEALTQATPVTSTPPSDRRHLAPPSANFAAIKGDGATNRQETSPTTPAHRLANFGLPAMSMYKIVTGLTIVIGAFLLFAWALRRGGRTAGRENLPADVVSVLGRVPLAARQFAELLRIGNKLVLVSLTPDGAQPLTEVTDPAEVDRLVGLCQQNNPQSMTKAFEQVFRQLSTEAAPSGFLGGESLPPSLASPAGAYRAYRGDTRG